MRLLTSPLCAACTTPARAAVTCVSTCDSCPAYPLTVSTRLGIRSARCFNCTSICAHPFFTRLRNVTSPLYADTPHSTTARTSTTMTTSATIHPIVRSFAWGGARHSVPTVLHGGLRMVPLSHGSPGLLRICDGLTFRTASSARSAPGFRSTGAVLHGSIARACNAGERRARSFDGTYSRLSSVPMAAPTLSPTNDYVAAAERVLSIRVVVFHAVPG